MFEATATRSEAAKGRLEEARVLIELIIMAALATLSVGLWTLRVAVTAKGRTLAAAAVAAVEAVVFVAAFFQVVGRLDSPAPLAAYAIGVGLGTALGLAIHARITRSHAQVEVVAPDASAHLVDALHGRGWSTTTHTAHGVAGPVLVASITVDDDRLDTLIDDITALAPDAFWTVRPVRAGRPVPLTPASNAAAIGAATSRRCQSRRRKGQ